MGCQPLEKGLWAGAIDSVGGEMLAWLTRTVQPYGVIASCGLVGGTDLHTSIMPFILRAISLLGISASSTPMTQRLQVWDYLADSMRPTHLEDIAHTIPFDRLEAALMTLLEGKALGRCVVSIL
jgi:NADPH2:quinone reductase